MEVAHAQRFAWSAIVAGDRQEQSPHEPKMRRGAADAALPRRDRALSHAVFLRQPRLWVPPSQRGDQSPVCTHVRPPHSSVPMCCDMERQREQAPTALVDVAATPRTRT